MPSQDAHRAPSRLAPPRPRTEWNQDSIPSNYHSPSRRRRTSQPADYEVVEQTPYEEYQQPEAPPHPARQREDDYDTSYRHTSQIMEGETGPVETTPREALPPREPVPLDYVEETNQLTKKERHQLLMHTVQLYDDVWKLAGIRANQQANILVAYLTPRNKRLDLKTAISRHQVLLITIDDRGNTDVKEPKKRGPWRRLVAWLYGE